MLRITTLLLLSCTCIVIASAFNAKLTKSFFFVNFYNQLSYKLLHTRSGIVAYSVETWQSNNEPFPQYLLLDYKTGYASPILQDVMNECNHTGAVVFDRLHYHVQTSTLVYYCTANNSLLILDEERYSVQDAIPIHLSETFAEAKLTGDGDFLYVLTMGTLYLTNQTSQLSKIDLTTRGVKNTMKLNKGLAPGEVVNGFIIQVDPEYLFEQQAFILTNKINEDNQVVVNIYYFNAGDDTYDLYAVTNFTSRSYILPDYLPVTVLYSIGDYLVTNNDTDLIVFTTQGEVVYRVPGLYSKSIAWTTGPYIPALVSQEGSLDLYAMFGETVLKISVVDSIVTAQEVANVSTMHIAYGNNNTNSLMLTTSSDQLNFAIKDLETSELVYTSLADYGGSSTDQTLMLSTTTYGVFTRGSFYIFDLKTDQLLLNITRLYLWSFLYDSNIFYYIDDLNSDTCQLKQLDLTTLAIKTLYEYPEQDYCFGSLTQLKFTLSGFPEHVISRGDNSFVIVTETFGAYLFTPPPEPTWQDMVVYDFGTASLHLLEVDYFGNSISIHYYDYDNITANFTEKDSYNISNTSVNTFYPIGDKKVVAVADGYFTMIDLQFGSIGNYTLPTRTFSVTGFYDNSYRKHLIFSDQRISTYWTGNVSQSMIFDSNGLGPIPGSTNFTVQARAAGFCSYSVVDGFVSSVGLVKFYNACSDQVEEKRESVYSILE